MSKHNAVYNPTWVIFTGCTCGWKVKKCDSAHEEAALTMIHVAEERGYEVKALKESLQNALEMLSLMTNLASEGLDVPRMPSDHCLSCGVHSGGGEPHDSWCGLTDAIEQANELLVRLGEVE